MRNRKGDKPAKPPRPKTEKTQRVMVGMVDEWKRRIGASRASKDRAGFMQTASICHQFYAGSFAFMWGAEFRKDFLSGIPAPRFKLTIAKAFDLVSVMGPSIMWDYPGRVIKSLKKFKMTPEMFGDMNAYQLYEEDFTQESSRDQVRDGLMSSYLNWAHREQPGGGMIVDSHKAVIEALVKGRGCLYTDLYKHPSGDDREFTRSTFFSVDDLYLDPECRNSNLTDCYWIAIKRRTPYWELERRFGLPEDSLKDKASKETLSSNALNNGLHVQAKRRSGLVEQPSDIVEWYEIFSPEGVGNRNQTFQQDYNTTIGDVVGDYAYLAICSKVDYPLNFPPKVSRRASDDVIRDAFEWPTPYWKDGRWPVALLDFYTQPNSAWPIAPLAMGLGELVLLNVIISCIADRVYEGMRTLGLVADQISNDVMDKLKNFDYSGFINVPGDVVREIKDLITYVQTPEVSKDVWNLIDYVSDMFDKRTGLIGRMYGDPSGQPRSAAESDYQNQATNTRPEWMGRKCEEWQTEVANLERIAAGWGVKGSSLVPLLGSYGAKLWDDLIADEDPDVFVLQMRATLEANSIKKPNQFRDNANLQQVSGFLIPMFDRYFQMTGDTKPINSFITAMAEAMDQDPTDWLLPEQEPPQPDPAQQIAQQSAEEGLKGKQLRNEKLQREIGGPAPMPGAMPEDMGGMNAGLPPEMMGGAMPPIEEPANTLIPGMVPQQFEPAYQMPYPPLDDLRELRLN